MASDLTQKSFKKELNNILTFWSKMMVDQEHGGFYGRMTDENILVPESDKGVILNCRILWFFSAAYSIQNLNTNRLLADRAYDYLRSYFFDTDNGGVYWMLDYQGNPLDRKKQIYAQAFAIYALTEYHKINPNKRALKCAIELYELIEKYSFDKDQNGYYEALTFDWKPLKDVRLSEKDLNGQKTMNTHLHILEAYTNLYRVWPDAKLKSQLVNLIQLMSTAFLYPSGHFKLFFSENWQLLSDEISFGHDIEGGWLLHEAAEATNDQDLIQATLQISLKMTNAALNGLDEDGGLMNHGKISGSIIDSDKHWWPQAEALVGLLNAYQLTDNDKYLHLAKSVWNFINKHIIDPSGEWYWRVNRDGIPQTGEDKAGPWKCPYHNGRAMIECIQRIDTLKKITAYH